MYRVLKFNYPVNAFLQVIINNNEYYNAAIINIG